jgi:lactoylglutathione lyase
MKRLHVHVSVADLAASIRFYSTLFGTAPTVNKDDYAKWQLEDPRVNFAISARGHAAGLNHLGIQTDSDAELDTLHAQLQQAELATQSEQGVACCYARSNKYWVTDPTGIAWETFHSLGSVPTFGEAQPAAASGAVATAASAAAPVPVPVQTAIPVAAKACCA